MNFKCLKCFIEAKSKENSKRTVKDLKVPGALLCHFATANFKFGTGFSVFCIATPLYCTLFCHQKNGGEARLSFLLPRFLGSNVSRPYASNYMQQQLEFNDGSSSYQLNFNGSSRP